jgi:cell division protein FtsQ
VAVLVWVLGWSSILGVSDRSRSPERPGPRPTAVAELVDVPIGTPLARVDTEAVAARVRERITVAEVSVRRAWPSTLAVDIVLQTPAIVVKNPQGQLEVVDAEGVAFGVVKAAPEGGPVVTAVGAREPLARRCSRRSRC